MMGTMLLTSCLDGDQMNTPPGASPTMMTLTYEAGWDAGKVSTGLYYFGDQALLLDQAAEVQTVTFAVAIQGSSTYDKDIHVNVVPNPDAANDNYSSDSIDYELLSDDQFKVLNTAPVIKAGERYVEVEVEFYPPNIDFTKSAIMPLTVTNDAGIDVSSNFGTFYPHIIGNPIAGLYTWDFIRVPDGGTSFTGGSTVFSPQTPTKVTAPTGYYTRPNYIITFKNKDGLGVLTDFKAVLDPAVVNGAWAGAGIVVTSGPTITVNDDYTKFTIHYTTATRDCTDIYTLK